MYGYNYNVKPTKMVVVEEPVERIVNNMPIWYNNTNTTMMTEEIEKELIQQQCWEPRHIVEKKLIRELLFAEEPRFVEKKVIRELLEIVEPKLIKNELIREILYQHEPRHVEKVFLRELLEQVQPQWVEKKIIRDLILAEQLVEKKMLNREYLFEQLEQQQPRFVEKKLIRELLSQEQPRHIVEKKLLRELLFAEEPRLVEKKLVRELLEVVEPRFVENKLVRELLYSQVEPRHIEKRVVRELLEQVQPQWVEKKIIRELILAEQLIGEPRYVEKLEKKLLTRELLEQLEQPRFVLEKELLRQPFEKVLAETKLMYPFERKEFLELKHTMPVIFNFPVDMTLPVVEREILSHKVEGRHIFPTSGYLHMVWKALAKLQGVMEIEKLPVMFEKVEFHRPTIMTVRGTPVKKIFDFKVKIVPTTGLFEIVEDEKVIVTGRVKIVNTKRVVLPQQQPFFVPMTSEMLRREEIYQQLTLKGFETEEELKTILAADLKCQYGEMLWTGKWVPFLEGLIQLKTFAKRRTTGIMIPRRINQLIIDPIAHMEHIEKKQLVNKFYMAQKYVLPVVYDRRVKKTVVGGVEIVELKGMFVPRIEKLEREVLFQQQPFFLPTVFPTTTFPVVNKGLEMFETLATEEQEINNLLINKLKCEYVQYYVEECKRIAQHIVKKVVLGEQQPLISTMLEMTVRPVPQTLKHLIEKIKYERKVYQHCPILTAIVEGGEFLQLLKTIVEEIQIVNQEECVLRRVKYVLGEKNMRFFQTLEKDVLLNLVNVKPHFVQLFKTILEQEIVVPRLPWTTTLEQEVVVPCMQPWNTTIVEPTIVELEKKIKMLEVEPRLRQPWTTMVEPRIFRSPSEIVLPKYF